MTRETQFKKSRSRILLACAHRIWNVPPLVNITRLLGTAGFQSLLLGYQAEGLPRQESLGPQARILRVAVRSRRLGIGAVRKIAATLEFLCKARRIVQRYQPQLLITFNEPASLLLRMGSSRGPKVAWLLEFPEMELANWPERQWMRWSTACWKQADALVVPNLPRLALHLCHRPELLTKKAFIVHNSPLRDSGRLPRPSRSAEAAISLLEQARRSGLITIVYSGAVGKRYAIDRLIRAVDGTTGYFLVILGKKHDLAVQEVNEALAACVHQDRTIWLDEIPYADLQQVLPHADVGFAHYLGDSLNTRFSAPGKLYEYLKAGQVLLTDEECCIRSEIRAAGCGVLFPAPATIEGLRRALGELMALRLSLPEHKQAAQRLFSEKLCLEQQMLPLVQHVRALVTRDRSN